MDRAVGHLLPGLLSGNPSLSNVETESIKIENQLLLYLASLHSALGPFLDMKIKSALKKSNCVYRGRNQSGILLFTCIVHIALPARFLPKNLKSALDLRLYFWFSVIISILAAQHTNYVHRYSLQTQTLYSSQRTPCEPIPTGKNLFSLQGTPFLIAGSLFSLQGFPCKPLYFPVRDCSAVLFAQLRV